MSLGLKNLIEKLKKQKEYSELCAKLLALPSLKPNEGAKTDSAHPAIFATGEKGRLTEKQKKIYDLIVRRFLATFGKMQ